MNAQTPTRPQPADLLSARALFRLGLFLVLGAVAFFLRYSFQQGWIGPVARVGLATATGLGMIVAGLQISARRPAYGNVLQGGGAAVLYLTAFAAHQRYELTDATGAFLSLIAISAGVVAMSLRQGSQPLAVSGIAGALIAPVAIGGSIDVFPGDTGYLLSVLGVASALYLAKAWSWLFASTAAGVGAILTVDLGRVVLFDDTSVGRAELLFGVIALWVIGWGVAVAGAHRHRRTVETATVVPTLATVTLPLFAALGTIVALGIDREEAAWMVVTLGFAAVHTVAFLVLRHLPVTRATTAVQLVPAALLSVAAWVGGLEGAALLAAVAAQAAVMVIVGIRSNVAPLALTGHVIAGVVSAAWVIVTFAATDATFDTTDIWSGVVVIIAGLLAFLLEGEEEPHRTLAQVYAALSLPAVLAWAALSLGPLPSGSGLVTGVWAVIGVGLIVRGRLSESMLVRNLGIAVVLLSVAKLLLVDLVTTSPLIRIGLFAGIGLALLVVGYWLGADEPEEADEAVGSTTVTN